MSKLFKRVEALQGNITEANIACYEHSEALLSFLGVAVKYIHVANNEGVLDGCAIPGQLIGSKIEALLKEIKA